MLAGAARMWRSWTLRLSIRIGGNGKNIPLIMKDGVIYKNTIH